MSELEVIYSERNELALAFAVTMGGIGYQYGLSIDAENLDWPVLIVDTPAGQVSWHLKRDEVPRGLPDYPGLWDGHGTPAKRARLQHLIGVAL